MKPILCAIDFSECSENAAIYASQLAKEFGSTLILINVYEKPLVFTETSIEMEVEIQSANMDASRKNMAKIKFQLVQDNPKLKIETIIEEGHPAEQICRLAEKENANLIVIGTTGKSMTKRILIGSTSTELISKSNCPVLVVPSDKKYNGINKIVFATDLHEDNLTVAQLILPFAKHFDSEIIFVFIDDKSILYSDEGVDEMTKNIRTHIKYNKMSGYISANTDVNEGIQYFVKKYSADLLVMFTHQKHFPKSLFSPSITKNMSQQTLIPLLSLPVKAHALTDL